MNDIKKPQTQYNINEEPIVVSKYLMDHLLGQPNYLEICGLYMFYYYTAKWQKTNQPKATNSYTAKGIGCSEDRLKKYKAQLIDLHLIENVIIKDDTESRIIGHYIKVNFIWSKEKINTLIPDNEISTRGKFHQMENNPPNALNINNKRNLYTYFLNLFPTNYQKNEDFQTSIKEFITHRNEKGKKLTELSCEKLTNKLKEFSIPICIKAINASIENGWTGVFPKSIEEKKNQPNFKISEYRPQYKYINGSIRYTLNPTDGEYYHKNGDKYVE